MTTPLPSLCASIETTAMVYLDDELADGERRELELHLLGCGPCKTHVERERAELTSLRAALGAGVAAPPPLSELAVARLGRGLDAIDAEHGVAPSRWRRWVLPGGAALAAAAALLVFVALPPAPPAGGEQLAREAVVQGQRDTPLEVAGASTGPWLERHFQAGVPLPAFPDNRALLVGARLTSLAGRPAAQLVYAVGAAGGPRRRLAAFVVDGLRPDALAVGQRVVIDGRALHVQGGALGAATVTYVDGAARGYVFTSSELSQAALLEVVIASNLIGDARGRVK